MQNITIDKVDINILKAGAYDRIAQMEQTKKELDLFNNEIARRANLANKNKPMEEETEIVPEVESEIPEEMETTGSEEVV